MCMIHHAEQTNPLTCKWSQAEAPCHWAGLVAVGRGSGAGGSRVLVSAVTARQCGRVRHFSEPGHDSTRIPVTTAQLWIAAKNYGGNGINFHFQIKAEIL